MAKTLRSPKAITGRVDMRKLIRDVQANDTVITPRLNQYLLSHQDDPYPQWIADWVALRLALKPRDRSASFSASAGGSCLRRQQLQFLGMPQTGLNDVRLQNIFDDGSWRHLRWQAMLMDAGILFTGNDLDNPEALGAEHPMQWRSQRLRGTADGYGYVPDNHPVPHWRGKKYGFELKGMNGFMYQRLMGKDSKDIKDEHFAQVHNYFLMEDFDLFVIIYEDKSTQAWHEWVIEPDEMELKRRRQELSVLNEGIDKQTLEPMLLSCKARRGEFDDCPFGGEGGSCVRTRDYPGLRKSTKTLAEERRPKKRIRKVQGR